jgi:hypothetical protein
MNNQNVKNDQSLENPAGDPESEIIKGEEAQQTGSAGQSGQQEDDSTIRKQMPKPEDYDFFLNVRRREQKEPIDNDEHTEY